MGALFDVVAPKLAERFAGRGMRLEEGPPQSVVFPAICADVGDLVITDDGDELTVVFGRFTHHHYGWDYPYPPRNDIERANFEEAIENLVKDLTALFGDRVVMYGGRSGVGGQLHWLREEPSWIPPGYGQKYVWSGPFRGNG
jgi:hypothetical protein